MTITYTYTNCFVITTSPPRKHLSLKLLRLQYSYLNVPQVQVYLLQVARAKALLKVLWPLKHPKQRHPNP